MDAYSRKDIDNVKYVASLAESWQPHELDLSDDRQWEFLMRQVERSGVTEETHPEYLKALRGAREDDRARGGPSGRMAVQGEVGEASSDVMYDANTISSFGINAAQTSSLGAAFSAIVNGTIFTSLYVQLIDTSNDTVLGENSIGPVYGEGEYLPIDLTGQLPNKEDLLMVFTWSYQPTAGAKPVQGSMRVSTAELPKGAPNVTEPLRTVTTKDYIKIGLGRPSGATDCDYWYNEPNIQNPNIRLPLHVTQEFQSNIRQPLWPSNITNPPTIYMIKPSTGGVTRPLSQTAIQEGITASGSTLTFNFPFNNDVSIDKSIQFGAAAWANDTKLLATISLGVKTETSNNEFVWVNIYGSMEPPWSYSPGAGEYQMYPIYYTWHCVAAGTQVLLADGSTAAIESIVGGEKVRAADGIFTVVDTFGTNKEDEVLVVRTEDGREVLITQMHPVLTVGGLVAARDLVAGDEIATDRGPSRIASVETRHYTGMVYSIGLGATPEEMSRFTESNTCFYANGIPIGDNRVCVEYVKTYQKRLRTVLARIPAEFHPEARRSYEQRYGASE